MLADYLANRAEFPGFAEVRSEPPDDGTVAADDGQQAGFPTADDDVVRGEALVALVEPSIRSNIRRRVDMQPVEAAPGGVKAGCGLDGLSSIRRETELVDMIARNPLPDNVTVPRHLDEAVVFEQEIGDLGLRAVRVGQDQRVAAADGRRALR